MYGIAQTISLSPKYCEIVDENRLGVLNHLVGDHICDGNRAYKKYTRGPTDSVPLDERIESEYSIQSGYNQLNKMHICKICEHSASYDQEILPLHNTTRSCHGQRYGSIMM